MTASNFTVFPFAKEDAVIVTSQGQLRTPSFRAKKKKKSVCASHLSPGASRDSRIFDAS